MESSPLAFAVTSGNDHRMEYANPAFCREFDLGPDAGDGQLISDVIPFALRAELVALLDQAFKSESIVETVFRYSPPSLGVHLSCSAWRVQAERDGRQRLAIEIRNLIEVEVARLQQRAITERMVLSALREQELASNAEAARQRAGFLSDVSRRLGESLDEATTLRTTIDLALPRLAAWCVADTIDIDGAVRRVITAGPGQSERELARELEMCWTPSDQDPIALSGLAPGAPAILAQGGVDALAGDSGNVNQECRRLIEALGAGAMLTATLTVQNAVMGAVTFVRHVDGEAYTEADLQLAGAIAERSAMALSSARLYGDAQRFRAEAETANRAKMDFLRAMSHELRTPLNAIGGYVDLIDMGIRGPVTSEQRLDFTRIRSNQQHLVGLIGQVLDFAKIDSGRLEYLSEEVAITAVLAGAASMLQPLADKRRIAFTVDDCEADVVGLGDTEKVMQILLNLIGNAIKFTSTGGSVSIECAATGNLASVRVRDTGIGIPEASREGIFEPFGQVSPSLTKPNSGIGLGLSISRQLARGMGGDVTVESILGEGSCFTLTLPLAQAPTGLSE